MFILNVISVKCFEISLLDGIELGEKSGLPVSLLFVSIKKTVSYLSVIAPGFAGGGRSHRICFIYLFS